MGRLIDANELLSLLDNTQYSIGEILSTIAVTTTIDPIHAAGGCYCKECKYLTDKHYEDIGEEPYIKHSCSIFKRSMQLTDFCSYGKVRTDERK